MPGWRGRVRVRDATAGVDSVDDGARPSDATASAASPSVVQAVDSLWKSLVEYLAQILCQKTGSRSRSPVVQIQPRGSRPPFFCIHPVSGNVFCYVDLARWLGDDQPFYGLQAPGLDTEQEPYARLEDMAAHYIDALRTTQPAGPYLLGGWSMGGIVAFEMARQLQAHGQEVALLALLDAWAVPPSASDVEDDRMALLGSFVQSLGLSVDQFAVSVDDFWQLSPDEQLTCVLDRARCANLVPPDVTLPQLRRYLRVFATNLRAVRSYVPQPCTGQLTLLRASDPGMSSQDSTLGWGNLAAEGVAVHTAPGNHFTMLKEPHVQVVARWLRSCIDEAWADSQGHGY